MIVIPYTHGSTFVWDLLPEPKSEIKKLHSHTFTHIITRHSRSTWTYVALSDLAKTTLHSKRANQKTETEI